MNVKLCKQLLKGGTTVIRLNKIVLCIAKYLALYLYLFSI